MIKWEQLTADEQREFERQWQIVTRGTAEVVPEDALRQKLIDAIHGKRPLNIKLGLDPSAPDIHIGHTVVLHKLRQFQELGHHVQLIIGDFTGRIGDPTGKSETRKQLSEEDVIRNAKTYQEQIFKILNPEQTTVYFNSAWLSKLSFVDVIALAAKTTVARMLERDDFSKRYTSGQAIGIHEFFYPLMQGYDSVHLQSDIELGGTDQKFNLLMGRTLQAEYGINPQATITLPLIEGLDGIQKMSKSLGNYIGIDEEPNEIYGKAMSIPDELMLKYYELATDITREALEKVASGLADETLHPRDAKMNLAYLLVSMFHGKEAADAAQQHFQTVFQRRALPEDINEVEIDGAELADGEIDLIKLLVLTKLQSSNGEARRSITQGAVRINQERLTNIRAKVALADGDVVQVGKRKIAKIRLV